MERWRATGDDGQILEASIRAASRAIGDGGVVAVPTETYYGLAADPGHPDALDRVLRLKGRERGKPLLLLVDGVDRVRGLVPEAPALLELLAERFWPGALTLVIPAPAGMHAALVGDTGGVAVRHPAHPVPVALVRRCDRAVTGTSANRAGEPPAASPDAIRLHQGPSLLSGILDAGTTPGGRPSTLLDLTGSRPRILRRGAVDPADLEPLLPGPGA